MSLNRKLAHNTFAQFIGKVAGTILALLATTQILRYLGPTEYGKLHIILTVVQITGIVADLGSYLIVLSDISHPSRDHTHIMSQHFIFRVYLNGAYLVLMMLLSLVVPYESVIRWGIALIAIVGGLMGLGAWFFLRSIVPQEEIVPPAVLPEDVSPPPVSQAPQPRDQTPWPPRIAR